MFTASFLSTNLSLKCSPHHFQTDQYMPQCWVYWIPSHDIPIIVGRHPHFCWGISLVFDVHHSPNMDGYILMLGWFPAGFPFRHPHYGCLASPRNWRSSFCFYLYVCWWSPCKIFESPFRVDYIYISIPVHYFKKWGMMSYCWLKTSWSKHTHSTHSKGWATLQKINTDPAK